MNRTAVLERLMEAKKHAGRNEILIATQKRIIATLTYTGTATLEAEKTLEILEQSQDLHMAEIGLLQDALDKLPLIEGET